MTYWSQTAILVSSCPPTEPSQRQRTHLTPATLAVPSLRRCRPPLLSIKISSNLLVRIIR